MSWIGLLWVLVLALPVQALAETVEYFHTDALGTPIAVTDTSGTLIETSEYEPYGKLLNRPVTDGPGFTGHVQDAATGLTYMQQRYYDPVIGRFLSVDPVTPYKSPSVQFNRYGYARNSPYRFYDPDGRCTGSRIENADGTCRVNGANTTEVISLHSSEAKQASGGGAYGRELQKTDPSWTRDRNVRSQMEQAWDESNPNSRPVPQNSQGSTKQEQGGWVVQFANEDHPDLVRLEPGTRDHMGKDSLHKPSEFECACKVLGFFHAHPNTREEGYMPRANGFDYQFQLYMGVPGMVRSHEGYEFIWIPEQKQ
ncbi:RHS domain-containing protein [Xanthomonas protegens]|uniref:RHS domain-containing protein n=1 Tax=Xanthomonas protegens TaxID=3380705 RepID=A0ABU9LCG2_9XANT